MDFSITSLLSNLSDAAQPASKKKSKKTKKAVVEDVVVDAAASEGPDSAVELAAAFGSTASATAPVLAPATFLNGSKKRKYSIDELLGDDAGSINEDEDRREMSGTQSKSAKKRAIKRDSAERLKRTVFLGNLAATITAKQVKRLMASVLAGQKGSLDSMLGKTAPAAAASAPADDDDELSEGEEPEKDLDDLLEEDVSDDDEAGGAAPLPPGARARIESVRLRSLPISGTPVASGSDYKAMRKACAIVGKIDTSAPINAYVVFYDSADAEAVLYLNGEVLLGRHIRVDLASGSETTKDSRLSVFIGNLPFTASEEQVRALFAEAIDGGNDSITNVRVVRDKATNRGKGIAYVGFKDRVHVFQALALHNKTFEGRQIRVTHCKSESGPKVSAAKVEALRRQKDMAVKRLKQSPRQKAKQEAKAKKMKNKEKKLVRTAKRQAKSSPAAAHK